VGAQTALPVEFLDATSLLGPKDRIAEKMGEFAAAGVTTLTVSPMGGDLAAGMDALRVAVDALDAAGVGG
jgi:hypothetical protein